MKAVLLGVGVGVWRGVEYAAYFEEVFGGLADLPILVVESGMECLIGARVVERGQGQGCPAPNGDAVGACSKHGVEAGRVADCA
jgi:hypothetical protein